MQGTKTSNEKKTSLKIALIELSNSHDECLFSQLKFLNSLPNAQVTLIVNEAIKSRVDNFDTKHSLLSIKKPKSFIDFLKLRKILIKSRFNYIIFNTAQGKEMKRLLQLPFPRSITFAGTLHNLKKLEKSFGQKLISRKIKRYYVLNDFLLEYPLLKNQKNLKFESFYPIYFPQIPQASITKPLGEIWICVPGQLEIKRRDYESLFESIAKQGIKNNTKFILLGRSAHQYGNKNFVTTKIKELNIENNFLYWEDYIELSEFFNYIALSDFILPLIHPNHLSYNLYKTQITGAFNLAFAYKIPLLMHESFKRHADFANNSIFYNEDNMMEIINSIPSQPTNLYKEEKWNFEFQKNKYLKHLGL